MSSDIFLSYAREDRDRVIPLVQHLEAEGWSVWWDPEIPVGRTFDEVIEEALDAARCVVVVWTEASVVSRWVKTEAEEGLNRQILAPVLMDEVRLPLAFRRIQTANLVGWEGEREHPSIGRLVATVDRIAGSPKQELPEQDTVPQVNKDFSIESLERGLLYAPLPETNDAGVNAVVMVRITVDPQGHVISMTPLQKGHPSLLEAVEDVLKRWRFSSLPWSAPRKNQTGIITFHFRNQ